MGDFVRAACRLAGTTLDEPQRVQQLRCLDLGERPLAERRKDVRLEAPKHRMRMVRRPLPLLIGVPLAREDLERVLAARTLLALFLLAQAARIGTCPDEL